MKFILALAVIVLATLVWHTSATLVKKVCCPGFCNITEQCCNDTCRGATCYNNSTHACVKGKRVCLRNEKLCGLTCYDPCKKVCFNNRIVCRRGFLPCKKRCYDPRRFVCINGHIRCRNSSRVLCGTTLCRRGELCCFGLKPKCYNPRNETCCRAENQPQLRTVCAIPKCGVPEKCCANVDRTQVKCFNPTRQFCCIDRRCDCPVNKRRLTSPKCPTSRESHSHSGREFPYQSKKSKRDSSKCSFERLSSKCSFKKSTTSSEEERRKVIIRAVAHKGRGGRISNTLGRLNEPSKSRSRSRSRTSFELRNCKSSNICRFNEPKCCKNPKRLSKTTTSFVTCTEID